MGENGDFHSMAAVGLTPQRAGAWFILTDIAANRSMERGQSVRIDELVHGLEMPEYPSMPMPIDPLDLLPVESAAPPWFKKERPPDEGAEE